MTEVNNVTELIIIKNVQEFTWNFADIKQSIEGNIAKYVGLVVTDDNLKDMETAQKEIASIRIKVDGFRKAVKKKMEEPYKVFEGEIKELLQLIEKAETPLKNQTLQYEQERIVAKEAELNKFAQTTALNLGVRNRYYNFIVQSKWTNRGANDKAVRKEIVTMVETMLDTQRRADELVEMEKQRVGLIEGQCIAHSAVLKTPVIPGDVNHLLVGVTLSDIPGIILAECQKRAEMEKKAADQAAAKIIEDQEAAAKKIADQAVVGIAPLPDHVHHPEDNSIAFPNYGHEIDPRPDWVVGGEINYQQGNFDYHTPIPPAPSTEILKPASFTLPPMPPRNYSPAPPMAPQLFKCVIEYPNITASEGAAIKEFLSARGIGYTIISQEPVRSDF